MNRFSWVIALIATFVGAPSLSPAANIRSSGPIVIVNEVATLRFRAPLGGFSPARRALNLAHLLQGLDTNLDIRIRRINRRNFAVVADGKMVIRISPADARANGTSVSILAARYASRLQVSYALPALQLAESELTLPITTSKFIQLVGSQVQSAEVSSSDPVIATASRVTGGIRLETKAPGQVRITVEANGSATELNIDVRPYAAAFPQSMRGVVAGDPATASTVTRTIEGAIRSQLISQPDSHILFKSLRGAHVGAGQTRSFRVRVSVKAPGAFPRTGLVEVSIRNIGGLARNDAELWYSNDPESVTKAGSLFSARLRRTTPVRLLYHHSNQASQAMFLRVQAVNKSDVAAHVVLIPGDSDPDRNPVRAGLTAAHQYLPAWLWGSGEVVTIPPKSSLPISLRRFSPGETVSGLCSLRLLDGPEDILVRTDAWPPFTVDQRWVAALASSTPWQEVGAGLMTQYDTAPYEHSESIYPNPLRIETVSYHVGGRYGFVRIGQSPINRQDNERPLDGNFGVVYSINARLDNPTSLGQDIEVTFESSAGYSGAIFSVNGKILQTPLLQPKEEAQLLKLHLAPGQVRNLEMITMPLSGSSYPATITIRPVQVSSRHLRIAR